MPGPPEVMIEMMSKAWAAEMIPVMDRKNVMGLSSGRVM